MKRVEFRTCPDLVMVIGSACLLNIKFSRLYTLLNVEHLFKFKDVVQSRLNTCLYGVLFFDLHPTTQQPNTGDIRLEKSNQIALAYLI
jgi:hypothetical protein